MNSINPHWIVVDIEPSIALARAECLQKYRAHPTEKPRAFDVMKDARVARATYQRDLMRQFVRFLVSWLRFMRSPRHDQLNYPADLQPSATAYPRGA
jgi:hypothetical protein